MKKKPGQIFSKSAGSYFLKIIIFFTCLLIIDSEEALAQNYKFTGAGIVGVNGIYTQDGSKNGRPKYINASNPAYNVYYEVFNTLGWWIDDDPDFPSGYFNRVLYDWNGGMAAPTFPVTGIDYDGNNGTDIWKLGTFASGYDGINPAPVSVQLATANMTFTNGSSFNAPNGIANTTNNVVGRFRLVGSSEGGVLQAVTVSISGSPTNVSNVKLWKSLDNTFNAGTDTVLSSKPDAASITFNGFNHVVNESSGSYYFITMDLGNTTGNVTMTIPSQSSFTFAGANAPGSFTNAGMSSGVVPLPVELNLFSASVIGKTTLLKWQTASETNNYGFEVESKSSSFAAWEKIGFVNGVGNSNSLKKYSFSDEKPLQGDIYYRLKQIDNDGIYTYSKELLVSSGFPQQFTLLQNYPNPFNPVTNINFNTAESGEVSLKVYNSIGEEIAELVNSFLEAGVYSINFRADELPSGIYIYRLSVNGKYKAEKKMNLIK